MTITFSIIIPCYNAVPFLRETLQSLHVQTHQDFEVIIVDDNSQDGSYDLACSLIKEFNLPGTVLRKSVGKKKGVAVTRNIAVEQACGTWLCFLDSDDLFHPRKLEVVSVNMERNSQADFHYHDVITIGEKEVVLGTSTDSEALQDKKYSIYDLNFIVTSSVVMKRSVFLELGGFNEALNGVEDYHLWLKVFSRFKVSGIQARLGYYRERNVSLMSGRKLSYYVNQNVLLVQRLDFLNEEQFEKVQRYMFGELMNYYCNISLSRYGYLSFVSGLFMLFYRGYPLFAMSLFFTKTKNHLLFKLFKSK